MRSIGITLPVFVIKLSGWSVEDMVQLAWNVVLYFVAIQVFFIMKFKLFEMGKDVIENFDVISKDWKYCMAFVYTQVRLDVCLRNLLSIFDWFVDFLQSK